MCLLINHNLVKFTDQMLSRRTFLKHVGRGVVFVASYPLLADEILNAETLHPTPPNTEGPYYRPGAPIRTDLRLPGEKGTQLIVSGSLVDVKERSIPGGLIEIWHADSGGEYDLRGFNHRASLKTSSDGKYSFRTIMPANYGGRPRHIHYKISAPGFENLTTQLYFENDPFFEGLPEKTLDKDPIVQYRELIRPVIPYREGEALSVIFKICLRNA
jgi:protocatechuate 3,4-dioxygenase beta subunit